MTLLPHHLLQTNFTTLDWIIVLIYLGISLWVGMKMRQFIHTMTDYIGAGRKVGTYLGVATMAGTEMGLITIMYAAQKGFTGGFAAFHIALIAGIVTFIVGATGFIVVPLRKLKVLTIPEFYEKRFDTKTRVLGGVLLALGGILNMGLFLKVGAMFIVGVTGLSSESWALPVIMTLLIVLVLVYTTLGGMMSVIVTDYIQFVVLSFGLLLVVGISLFHFGWTPLFETVKTLMGPGGLNPVSAQSEFGWAYVLWMVMTAGLVSCAIWPTAVARALAMTNEAAVKTQYKLSAITFMIRFLIPNFLGICALVYIVQTPALNTLFFPKSGPAIDSLMAMPIYLGHVIPTGLLGLITAAMIAAFMSTHDSYLLCWSSVITQDIIAPLRKTIMTQTQRINWTRIIICVIGVYIWYWGLWYQGQDDIWDYMAITGAIYFTGAFAVLVGGLYWQRASTTGALWALIAGSSALLGLEPIRIGIGLGSWTGTHIGLFSVALTTVAMILGSLLFPDLNRSGLQPPSLTGDPS